MLRSFTQQTSKPMLRQAATAIGAAAARAAVARTATKATVAATTATTTAAAAAAPPHMSAGAAIPANAGYLLSARRSFAAVSRLGHQQSPPQQLPVTSSSSFSSSVALASSRPTERAARATTATATATTATTTTAATTAKAPAATATAAELACNLSATSTASSISSLTTSSLLSGGRDPRDAVVKIFNTRQRPGWTVPWQDQPVESSTGSGAVVDLPIKNGSAVVRLILTAAHVIADTRYLQVQRGTDRFSGEKYRASIAAVCHEADLALLYVHSPVALEMIKPLKVAPAEKLPQVFDKVRVVGYPVGGDACSITEGVVSRVEVQEYSHSLRAGLALTVDAAINSGNSGGPLVDAATAEIVGVAFQKLVARGVELQGHAVPAPLIQRFLAEVQELVTEEEVFPPPANNAKLQDRYPLRLRLPSLGCDYQSLEPPALRRSLGLGDRSGVLVGRLHTAGATEDGEKTEEPTLKSGDVLLEFNGYSLDEMAFCSLLGRRLHFAAARDLCQVGQKVPIKVWREGEELELEHTLNPARYLVPRGQFDVRSKFFICGGLVFQPLSHEYLQGWSPNERPPHLQNLFMSGHLTPHKTEAIMISQILADEINAGYDSGWVGAPIVQAVNGEPIRDLFHLIDLVTSLRNQAAEGSEELFIRFDVQMSSGPYRLVLPVNDLPEADSRICQLYGVPEHCRSFHYMAEELLPVK